MIDTFSKYRDETTVGVEYKGEVEEEGEVYAEVVKERVYDELIAEGVRGLMISDGDVTDVSGSKTRLVPNVQHEHVPGRSFMPEVVTSLITDNNTNHQVGLLSTTVTDDSEEVDNIPLQYRGENSRISRGGCEFIRKLQNPASTESEALDTDQVTVDYTPGVNTTSLMKYCPPTMVSWQGAAAVSPRSPEGAVSPNRYGGSRLSSIKSRSGLGKFSNEADCSPQQECKISTKTVIRFDFRFRKNNPRKKRERSSQRRERKATKTLAIVLG